MHRSSESISALAAALAKAQTELSNPEKSLVGTIGTERPGEGARTFRYASLSRGLDIVRKALGQQQIATVQTTAIDAGSGTINLTTVLAHASGEWIASDWPVCRLADTASPHRMGAALTYARRYSLFTLVGIAGEDDLDAPDLNGGPPTSLENRNIAPEPPRRGRPDGNGKGPRQPLLDPENSAALRDRLVREIADISTAEAGAEWARSALAAKNTLTASDARLVQLAFELRLSALQGDPEGTPTELQSTLAATVGFPETRPPEPSSSAPELPNSERERVDRHSGRPTLRGIDKSVLSFSEVRRYRDKAHIKFVASRPCLVCGRKPVDPHHLRFAQVRALGRKVSDEFTVPLCRMHHREVHRARNEADWWSKLGIDALAIALKLWRMTRSTSEPAAPLTLEATAAASAVEIAPPESRVRRRPKKAAGPEPVEIPTDRP
jgi:ERF superfamily protein